MSSEQRIKFTKAMRKDYTILVPNMLSNHFSRDVHTDRDNIFMQIRNNYINWDVLPADLPDNLRNILRKMLAYDPQERYCDCGELAHSLEYYVCRNGCGPTTVSLAEYMRKVMPGKFAPAGEDPEVTRILPPDYFEQNHAGEQP